MGKPSSATRESRVLFSNCIGLQLQIGQVKDRDVHAREGTWSSQMKIFTYGHGMQFEAAAAEGWMKPWSTSHASCWNAAIVLQAAGSLHMPWPISSVWIGACHTEWRSEWRDAVHHWCWCDNVYSRMTWWNPVGIREPGSECFARTTRVLPSPERFSHPHISTSESGIFW